MGFSIPKMVMEVGVRVGHYTTMLSMLCHLLFLCPTLHTSQITFHSPSSWALRRFQPFASYNRTPLARGAFH